MTDVVGTARVIIVPDTTAFAGTLSSQLAASTAAMTGAVGGLNSGLAAAQTQLATFGTSATAAGAKLTKSLTLPIVAIGGIALKAGADFQTAMLQVQAVSGATGVEFESLNDLAKELGRTTQFSASQAADAMGFLAMAGFEANEILGALPGTLNLAAAGNLELAQAADIVTNILTGYGKEVGELGAANDALVQTFTSSNTSLAQLGEAFKFVAPVAASAGLDFNEVTAALGLLGNAGIQASMAGTTLRGGIAKLAKPTNEAQGALERLGIQVNDSGGQMLPLVDIIRQFEAAGLSTADAMTIFGLRAGPGFAALVSQGADALGDLTTQNALAGEEAELAAKALGLEGSVAEGLTEAFLASLPVIQQYNENTDETTAILGALTVAGQDASESAESLAGIVTSFNTDAGAFAEALGGAADGLGFMVDETGQLVQTLPDGTVEVVSLLEAVTLLEGAGLSTQDLMAKFGDTVGGDLAAALSVGSEEMLKIFEETGKAGRAAEIAEIQMSGVRGSMLRLKSAAEGVAIAFSEAGVLDALAKFAEFLTNIFSKLATANPAIFKFVAVVGLIAASIGPVLLIIGKLSTGLAALSVRLTAFSVGGAIGGAIKGIKALGLVLGNIGKQLLLIAFNPVTLAIGLFVGAMVLAWKNSEALREAVGRLADILGGIFAGTLGAVGDAVSKLAGLLGDKLAVAGEFLGDKIAVLVDAFADWLENGLAAVSSFIEGSVVPAVSKLGDFLGELASALSSTLGPAIDKVVEVVEFLADVFNQAAFGMENAAFFAGDLEAPIAILGETFFRLGVFVRDVIEIFEIGIDVIKVIADEGLANLTSAVGNVIDAFRALASGDFDGFVDSIRMAGDDALEAVVNFAIEIPLQFFDTLAVGMQAGLDQLASIDVLSPLVASVSAGLTTVVNLVSNLGGAIAAALRGDFDQAGEFFSSFLDNLGTLITTNIPAVLSGLSELISGPVSDAVSNALTAAVGAVKDIPVVGPLAEGIQLIIESAIDLVAGRLDFFSKIFQGDFGGAVEVLRGRFSILLDRAATILFELIPAALGDLGTVIGETLVVAFDGLANVLEGTPLEGIFRTLAELAEPLAGFLADNLVPALATLATILLGFAGASVVPGIIAGIAGALATVGAVIATILSPIGLLVAGIAAIGFAFFKLLQDNEGFREGVLNAINAVVEGFTKIPDVIGVVVEKFGAIVDAIVGFEPLQRAIENVGVIITGLLPILDSFIGAIVNDIVPALQENLLPIIENVASVVGTVLQVAFAALTIAIEKVTEVIAALVDAGLFDAVADAVGFAGEAFGSAIEAIRGFTDIIAGIFSGDLDQITEGITGLAQGILDTFTSVLADLPGAALDAILSVNDVIFGGLSNIPVIGELFETIQQVIGDVGIALQGVFDILGGIFSLDGSRILDGLAGVGEGFLLLLGEAFTNLPELLAGILGDGIPIILGAFSGIGEFIADKLSEVPLLGEIFETIGQVVNDVADGLSGIFDIIAGIITLDPGRIAEGLGGLGESLLGIFREALTAIPEILVDIISDAVPFIADALGGIGDFLSGLFDDVPIIGEIFDTIGSTITGVGDALGGIFDIIAGIVSLDFGRVIDGIKELAGGIGNALFGILANVPQLLADLGFLILDGLAAAFPAIGTFFTDTVLPAIGTALAALPGLIGSALSGAADLLGALAGWLLGVIVSFGAWIFSDGIPAIIDFFVGIPAAIGDFFSGGGADDGGGAGGGLIDWATKAFAQLGEWLVNDGIPAVVEFVAMLPGKIVEALAGVGSFIWDGIVVAFNFVRDNIGEWVGTIAEFFNPFNADSIWAKAAGLLLEVGSFLWDAISGVLGFVFDNFGEWAGTLAEFFNPFNADSVWARAVLAAAEVGSFLWDALSGLLGFVFDNFGTWIGTLAEFFNPTNPDGLVQRAIGLAATMGETIWNGIVGGFNFVKDNIGTWVGSVVEFFNPLNPEGLVQKAIGFFSTAGETIWGGISGAFTFIKDKVGEAITGIAEFFNPTNPDGLVSKVLAFKDTILEKFGEVGSAIIDGIAQGISGAANFVGDFVSNIGRAFVDFINVQVIDRINDAIPNSLGPVNIPDNPIPHINLAEGGIFDRPTVAQIGEAGAEVVIPLTNVERALALAEQSGLTALITHQLTGQAVAGAAGVGAPAGAGGPGGAGGAGAGAVGAPGGSLEAIANTAGTAVGEGFTAGVTDAIMASGAATLDPAATDTGMAAGMAFNEGMTGGLEQSASMVEMASAGVVGAAEAAAIAAAQIASPSQVFFDIGMSLSEGLAAGMEAGTAAVAAAGAGAVGAASGGAGAAGGAAASAIGSFEQAVSELNSVGYFGEGLQGGTDKTRANFASNYFSDPDRAAVLAGTPATVFEDGSMRLLADGGIITDPTRALIGEAGPEVVLPLTNPKRVLELATASGLFGVLAEGLSSAVPSAGPVGQLAGVGAPSTPTPNAVTPRPEPEQVVGSSGSTFNIYGVSADDVVAKIVAREETAMRGIRR
ncbi:MAG TPA: phage tail tape measure protein [Acidimicrobiales bacterium]|nr:phage tail tape measure protein [Acidimicrobiales bacterium]